MIPHSHRTETAPLAGMPLPRLPLGLLAALLLPAGASLLLTDASQQALLTFALLAGIGAIRLVEPEGEMTVDDRHHALADDLMTLAMASLATLGVLQLLA